MTESSPILLYDIAGYFGGVGPPKCFAPNTWKARYALNFKNVNYKTHWVELPDVQKVRRDELKVAPVRTHGDGSDYYTLPVIHDTATGAKIGDSFAIAVYLDQQYPGNYSRHRLIPQDGEDLMRAWNAKIDALFSGANATFGSSVLLTAHALPLNPETAQASKDEFVRRVPGILSWEQFNLTGEAREKCLVGLQGQLRDLFDESFKRQSEGPFLEGKTMTYADCILAAWVRGLRGQLPREEWARVRTWQGGVWERLLDSVDEIAGQEK